MRTSLLVASCAHLLSLITAAPLASTSTSTVINSDVVSGFLQTVTGGIEGALEAADFTAVLSALESVVPTATPASVSDVTSGLQAIVSASPSTIFEYIAALESLGLVDNIESLEDYLAGAADGQNSMTNLNPDPPVPVYPQKSPCDAPYSVPESILRAAIYIPSTFTRGQIPPVILFPGTGSTGYLTFKGNFIPLLQGSTVGDPVWVNVPGYLLGDAQVSAEFAAYAINYISSLSGGVNVTFTAWSQGNIDGQWAYKYWPSTRCVVSDHVAISPDYAGTVIANFATPPGVPQPPSLLQQRYLSTSNFITTLRADGGDSAYVPTTTIYSSFFDEIVEPQQGTGASAYLLSNTTRGALASNNEAQVVCGGRGLAGTFYTHEGMLYNPLSYALFLDAMANPGPGDPNRLDLNSVCVPYQTPGLDLADVLLTENTIPIAGIAILLYQPKVLVEPPIMAYATNATIINCNACFFNNSNPNNGTHPANPNNGTYPGIGNNPNSGTYLGNGTGDGNGHGQGSHKNPTCRPWKPSDSLSTK